MAHCPSLEIDGDGGKRDGAGIAGKAPIAGAGESVDVLDEAEERFDRRAMLDDALVAPHLCRGERQAAMASAHDAIPDAAPFQALASLFAVIGFVGIDDLLVAADELFGRSRSR